MPELAVQTGDATRVLLGSPRFQARPRKTPTVNNEFTFSMPSKARTCMLVVEVLAVFSRSVLGVWLLIERLIREFEN